MEIIPGPKHWHLQKIGHRSSARKLRIIKLAIYLLLTITIIYLVFTGGKQTSWQNHNLKSVVEESLVGARGTYGVVVKHLKTNESYYLNETKEFEAGSLYKIWLMAEVFHQIEDGKLTEDQVLSEDVATLHGKFNISSESAELKEGTVTLAVKDALNQMITISHNYAALLLTEEVRISAVKAFLERNNFKHSAVGEPPTTTPADISLFLEKLYKGELGNQQSTQRMLDLLKNQNINDKLPKNLPKDVSIAHKTAEIGYFSHDGGIVFGKKGDYIIVVLSESDYPPGVEERIAQISKAVYEYFETIDSQQSID